MGFAAIVAYMSCIGLSLIQLLGAYFAPIFIIYHQKLIQLEENTLAINRLLERQEDLQVVVNQKLEEKITQISGLSLAELELDASNVEAFKLFAEKAAALGTEDADSEELSETVDMQETPEDKNQIFLSFEPVEEAEGEEEMLIDDADMVPEFNLPTHIQVYSFIGNHNELFIRGDAPLSWEEGKKMDMLDVGKFEIIVDVSSDELSFDLYINDQIRAEQSPLLVQAGDTIECYPEFKKSKRGRNSG